VQPHPEYDALVYTVTFKNEEASTVPVLGPVKALHGAANLGATAARGLTKTARQEEEFINHEAKGGIGVREIDPTGGSGG